MIEDSNQRREQCQKQAKLCQSKFNVPALSSHEWLQQQETSSDWILVDVRTAPERRVSMIRGAKTLAEFDQEWRAGTFPPSTKVAFYCTIGYRSGIHASKYVRRLEGRVYNLDGIVAFSQAVVDRFMTHRTPNPSDWLIDPHSGAPTNGVHTFGALWNFVDTEIFLGVYYSRPALLVRMLQVGFSASGHHAREGLYFLKRIASRRKSRHKHS
ncbi:hypothetical protein FisN_19Hu103 [Fistulifera solaris]|jgi:rhodanese-related sulfurtransferase|uniref:Rhodanese domain-containing protein n=1 Tax=Fistulifera solaris TaxID=1519565 RepID=A0A1Z5JZV0_FISSO|nr:hypothetical protein FisN_19Hu103 [Fistulifera solaris]|eukprot:GAX19527.1 hypothetical protein FisN_19Hu103 [Fistulifera solaris]